MKEVIHNLLGRLDLLNGGGDGICIPVSASHSTPSLELGVFAFHHAAVQDLEAAAGFEPAKDTLARSRVEPLPYAAFRHTSLVHADAHFSFDNYSGIALRWS